MSTPAVAQPATSPEGSLSLRDLGLGLVYALIALLISGSVLATGFLLFSSDLSTQRAAANRDDIRPWPFSGGSLIARRGSGEDTESGALRITELHEEPQDTRGIFTRPAGFKAENFPYLEYSVSGQNPETFVYFIWRSATNPEETSYIPLPRVSDEPQIQILDGHPEWQGSITEIGIDVYGELRDSTPVVDHLTLLTTSPWYLLRAIWGEWAGLEIWTQRSAHHLMGGPDDPILARPLAMACWAAGALVLLGLARWTLRVDTGMAALLAILLPWLVTDMLWQRNLSAQLEATRELYSGKTPHEKKLVSRDGALYEYALRLKREVLPAPGAKIYLLHDSPRRFYTRLKMQYYLLPHNIYNFGKYPMPEHLRDGDYLLELEEIPGLEYDEATGTLRWRDQSLPITRVDTDAKGSLYLFEGLP